jgi:hypothetical protein
MSSLELQAAHAISIRDGRSPQSPIVQVCRREAEGRALHGVFVRLERSAVKVCAAGRGAESVTQSREVRRETSGPSVLPEGESQRGQEHGGKARDTGRRHKGRLARPAR